MLKFVFPAWCFINISINCHNIFHILLPSVCMSSVCAYCEKTWCRCMHVEVGSWNQSDLGPRRPFSFDVFWFIRQQLNSYPNGTFMSSCTDPTFSSNVVDGEPSICLRGRNALFSL